MNLKTFSLTQPKLLFFNVYQYESFMNILQEFFLPSLQNLVCVLHFYHILVLSYYLSGVQWPSKASGHCLKSPGLEIQLIGS